MSDKTCSKCGESFPLTNEFWPKRATSKDGFRGQCLNCWREKGRKQMARWRRGDPPEPREIKERKSCLDCGQEFANTSEFFPIHGKYLRPYCRSCWRERQHDYDNKNREAVKSRKRNWNANERNKEKINERATIRRHNLRTTGKVTAQDRRDLLEAQNYKCFHCGADLRVVKKHMDHWIPVKKGGTNDFSNLRYLCAKCNLSKGAKLPHEWHPEIYS